MDFLNNFITPYGLSFRQVIIRCVLAVVIGGLIGIDRARHGRAAGMRTHILVCIGAALTSMTGLYLNTVLMQTGDIARLPAQVISGIGFLGAGMIILKNNNMLIGLTTAAGVWATGCIGIAIGYGFYFGAITVAVLFLLTINLFARFEKRHKSTEVIYVELDDMYSSNDFILKVGELIANEHQCQVLAPKSGKQGNIGINIVIDKHIALKVEELKNIDHVVYAVEEKG